MQNHLRFLLCALFLLIMPSWSQASTFTKTRSSTVYALLVGVQSYADKNIERLNFTTRDVQGTYDALTKFRNVPKQNIFMLLNQQATKMNILTVLGKLKTLAKANDTVIFYYSGHGWANAAGKSFLLPYDTKASSERTLQSTGLLQDYLAYHLSRLKSKNVVLLLDACNNGLATDGRRSSSALSARRGERKQLSTKFFDGSGFTVIAASQNNQPSYESKRLKHGLFSYALINGLKGAADNPPYDGRVNVSELYNYLSHQVPVLARKYKKREQLPNLTGNMAGSPVVAIPGLRNLKGQFVIRSNVPAQLVVNQRLLSNSMRREYRIIRPIGKYKIQLRREGYMPYEVRVELKPFAKETIVASLIQGRQRSQFGQLEIKTSLPSEVLLKRQNQRVHQGVFSRKVLKLPPGDYTIKIRRDEYVTQLRRIRLARGVYRMLDINMVPISSGKKTETIIKEVQKPVNFGPWPFVTMGVGGAALATGVVFQILSLNSSEFASSRDFQTTAIALYIAGGVVTVTGLILFFAQPKQKPAQAPSVSYFPVTPKTPLAKDTTYLLSVE